METLNQSIAARFTAQHGHEPTFFSLARPIIVQAQPGLLPFRKNKSDPVRPVIGWARHGPAQ